MTLKTSAGIALTAALCAVGPGCAGRVSVVSTVEEGYADDRGTIQMVTTLVSGKNVFVPSTVVVSEGGGRTLTIYNTTDTPHGFRIPALAVEAILEPGKETVVALPRLEGGNIYDIVCHLHPPHRHATLVVVRAR